MTMPTDPCCTFCGAPLAEGAYLYPIPDDPGAVADVLGEWAACDSCHRLIKRHDDAPAGQKHKWRLNLARHCAATITHRYGVPRAVAAAVPALTTEALRLHTRFWEHRTGPPQPWPAPAPAPAPPVRG
jgi:hypothetical protein